MHILTEQALAKCEALLTSAKSPFDPGTESDRRWKAQRAFALADIHEAREIEGVEPSTVQVWIEGKKKEATA